MKLKEFNKLIPELTKELCGLVTCGVISQERADLMIESAAKDLQNFADKICEKQRENCAKTTLGMMYKDGMQISAPQPKIEEL